MTDIVEIGNETYINNIKISDLIKQLKSKNKKKIGSKSELKLLDVDNFNNILNTIQTDNLIASPLKINVFVVCADLNVNFNLSSLYAEYLEKSSGFSDDETEKESKNENKEPEGYIMKYNPECKKGKKITKNQFFNCLTISFNINKIKISCKIFDNGKLQINGCKEYKDCFNIPKIIYNIIDTYKDVCIDKKDFDNFKLTDIKLGMINSGFHFQKNGKPQCINRELLTNIINNNTWDKGGNWRIGIFQTGKKYHGIKAPFWIDETVDFWKIFNPYIRKEGMEIPETVYGQCSVLIFRTGKVIITGSKCITHIKAAYEALVKIANEHNIFK